VWLVVIFVVCDSEGYCFYRLLTSDSVVCVLCLCVCLCVLVCVCLLFLFVCVLLCA